MVTVWLTGSGDDKGATRSPAVAWQMDAGGAASGPHSMVYQREGGCTLPNALIRHITHLLRDLVPGSSFHLIIDMDFIVGALGRGDLQRWVSSGFMKEPAKNRDEWRELWELLQDRKIAMTAAMPDKWSRDAQLLKELRMVAARRKYGWDPVSIARQLAAAPRAKDVLDYMRENAMDKDRDP
jgi:hypothetical protein